MRLSLQKLIPLLISNKKLFLVNEEQFLNKKQIKFYKYFNISIFICIIYLFTKKRKLYFNINILNN